MGGMAVAAVAAAVVVMMTMAFVNHLGSEATFLQTMAHAYNEII
jgi:hypothetical protein